MVRIKMKILKILLGVPVFFILELVARIFVPLFAALKTKQQKDLMLNIAQEALLLNVLDCAEDFRFKSMLNRLSTMPANFKHLVETAFILADPETVYDDPSDVRREPAKKLVTMLLQYKMLLLGIDVDLVDVDAALASRRSEWKHDYFGFKWYKQLIDYGLLDQYLFYVSTKQCGVWLSPLKSGGK